MISSNGIDLNRLIYHYLVGENGLARVFPKTSERNESKIKKICTIHHLSDFGRFLIKPKPAPPRRDVHLHHVIINDKADQKISEHRVSDAMIDRSSIIRLFDFKVSELPFPFANADQFEAIIQQPLGREWNPETAFRRLNQPKVRTRIGVRIEPLDKEEVFIKKNRSQKTSISMDNDPLAQDEDQVTSNLEQDSLFDHNSNKKKKKFSKKMK